MDRATLSSVPGGTAGSAGPERCGLLVAELLKLSDRHVVQALLQVRSSRFEIGSFRQWAVRGSEPDGFAACQCADIGTRDEIHEELLAPLLESGGSLGALTFHVTLSIRWAVGRAPVEWGAFLNPGSRAL